MLADTGTFYSVDMYDGEWALEHGDARGLAGRDDAQAARSRRSAARRSCATAVEARVRIVYGTDSGVYPHGLNGQAVRVVHALRDDAARGDPERDGRRGRVPGLVGPGRIARRSGGSPTSSRSMAIRWPT